VAIDVEKVTMCSVTKVVKQQWPPQKRLRVEGMRFQ